LAIGGRRSQSIDQLVLQRRRLGASDRGDDLAATVRAQADLDDENDRDTADQFAEHLIDFLVVSELLGRGRKTLPLSATNPSIVNASRNC
jgi:hypothetical protein